MIVSIVIPCFNQAAFVGEAIESALTQSETDVDVVVVNDGSTDGSATVIAASAAGHSNVRIVTQTNRGLSAARNAGLAVARGDIVIFLDADDRLRPVAAQAAIESFARHPDAMLTFGRCQVIDETGGPMPTNLPTVGRDFYAELLRRNFIWTPAMAAFRRSVFDTVGQFNPDVNQSADYDMYLRVARCSVLADHDTVVAEYRQHGSSMSRNPVAMLNATLAVHRSQGTYVAAHPELRVAYREGQRAWRALYGEHLVEQFRAAFHAGRYLKATGCAGQLLRLYPEGVAHHLHKKWRLMRGRQPLPQK